MSRVTIGDITEDLLPFTEKGNKVIPVEIVPRKIVEKIIEWCDSDITFFGESTDSMFEEGRLFEAKKIKGLAEYLLEVFEEGD